MEGEVALDQAMDYFDAVCKSDISRVDGIRRNTSNGPKKADALVCRNQGAQVPVATIAADRKTNDEDMSDVKTITSYIDALKKDFCDRRCSCLES